MQSRPCIYIKKTNYIGTVYTKLVVSHIIDQAARYIPTLYLCIIERFLIGTL